MSNENPSRFVTQNKTTHERLSTTTVGLVKLSDFRKRRAEPDACLGKCEWGHGQRFRATGEEAEAEEKKKVGATKLSFGDDEEEEGAEDSLGNNGASPKKPKLEANASVGIVPKTLTKAAIKQEAAERESLRREFLQIQDAVKATEIAVPFVFYDGTNIPGGVVRVKKGDFVWVFLDKSRKVGAEMQVGRQGHRTQAMGKSGRGRSRPRPGKHHHPTYRRWYERNKHIYPASLWQEFDPEKDYQNQIRRDLGGNAFFYSK
ncbi:unnamed protein product [Parascedosporium putredinis]|uniref:FAM50A/XAP5 C-terminal domain-containing protein n=1 Tax=Parascedosporium putredinis TaxID=1442378 RepID=A0A9P1M9Y0_9PEZI|nr:unnamed protein product [Parascedosporium putredinis]CAI7991701.1 unnamed protein product [Parascedosporium putredinis]